jgi:hypothetical protein
MLSLGTQFPEITELFRVLFDELYSVGMQPALLGADLCHTIRAEICVPPLFLTRFPLCWFG